MQIRQNLSVNPQNKGSFIMFKRYMIVLLVVMTILLLMTFLRYGQERGALMDYLELSSECTDMLINKQTREAEYLIKCNSKGSIIGGLGKTDKEFAKWVHDKQEARYILTRNVAIAWFLLLAVSWSVHWIWKGRKKQ